MSAKISGTAYRVGMFRVWSWCAVVGGVVLVAGCGSGGGGFVEPEMVLISGACFDLGSPPDMADRREDEAQRRVCVADFHLGKYEVTQAQWRALMRTNPSRFAGCNDCPVERVSWNEALDYIEKLRARTGKQYRLPTEAEWEYACRSGGMQQRYCGGDNLDQLAWFSGNSQQRTRAVGQLAPNRLGLYDMSGNVWEWTCSLYRPAYDGTEQHCADRNHAGPRVFRGGSWENVPARVRATVRYRIVPTHQSDTIGFRLALDAAK